MSASPSRRHRVAAVLCGPLLVALAVTTAAAVPAASAQEASPSPAAPPGAVTVGTADSGRTVHLVPGQELVVDLVAPSAGEHWQGPLTTGPLYLVEYSEGAERTTARLEALHAGDDPVVLRARTDRACFHSDDPCPQGFSEWSLTVVVDDGPPADASYPCITRPVVSPAPGYVDPTVTEQHDGGSRRIELGSVLRVHLHSCTDHYAVPRADGPLHRESASARANGAAVATFRALRLGTTTITSYTDPACFHSAQPCARPVDQWSFDVEVVPDVADDRCLVPAAVELDRGTVTAMQSAAVTVRTAAGTELELYAYTRPSTTYRLVRSAVAGESGVVTWHVRPPANTRLYAQERGCQPGPSAVLNVGTALTLDVLRTGPRAYVFSGDSLPARAGGLVVSLYRITDDSRQVLTAQARAGSDDGEWSLRRVFTGTGRFGFVARTGQDLQNAPGRSGVRSLLVF